MPALPPAPKPRGSGPSDVQRGMAPTEGVSAPLPDSRAQFEQTLAGLMDRGDWAQAWQLLV
jgi:hypothetical protein